MIRVADLFCGAGGSSTGLALACAAVGQRVDLTAVNHWPLAIETHSANHPWARHLCESLDGVDPRKVIPGARLDILTASPECIHHSNARGGKPMDDQSRATAWHVLRWADALRPTWILVENVREFVSWGPLGRDHRPLKSKRGVLFRQFVDTLTAMGYRVEWRVLNAANYGAATTRERFFLVGRLGRAPIPWPVLTHGPADAAPDLFAERQPWRAAREIIDFQFPSRSIFGREKPLAANTLRRIAAGARKFWGVELEPFLYQLSHGGRSFGLDRPLPTITAEPTGGDFGVVEPFLVPFYGERPGQAPRTHAVRHPLPTVVTDPKFGMVEPFLLQQQSGGAPRGVGQPVPTVATKGAISLVEAFLLKFYGSGANVHPVGEPIGTITTKDRFGLVEPAALDIRFRMLQPHELAAGMGFPAGYKFAGNRGDQVKQIGHAVEVNQARALFAAMLEASSRRAA
ncbi:MAG: DNA cytosine methyltransferase [Vicinamibacterales bacterium]